ncbi:MAG: hypothetical protein ABSG51_02285 [Terracidiphilus sp.]|jgi:hypothetical protein
MLWDITRAARLEDDGGGYLIVAKGLDNSRRPGSKLYLQVSSSVAKTMIEPFGLGGELNGKLESYLEDQFKGTVVADGQVISIDEKLAKRILSY